MTFSLLSYNGAMILGCAADAALVPDVVGVVEEVVKEYHRIAAALGLAV